MLVPFPRKQRHHRSIIRIVLNLIDGSMIRSSDRLYSSIFFLVCVWGVIIRSLPLILHGEVDRYHSGGLFYVFIKSIQESGYKLPDSIPFYSSGGIPFAYPPLIFFITALLDGFTNSGPEIILTINIIFSSLAIPALYWALKKTELSYWGRLLAGIVFTTLPLTFGELLPGEGLAESFGMLCFIIFLGILIRTPDGGYRNAVALGVILGINVMTSPGTAMAAPLTTLVYFFLRFLSNFGQRKSTIQLLLLSIIISILVSCPYLFHLSEIYYPESLYLSFRGQGGADLSMFFRSLLFSLLSELVGLKAYSQLFWTLFLILGIAYCVKEKKYFWVIGSLVIAAIPREGRWLFQFPFSVLAAFGATKVAAPAIILFARRLFKKPTTTKFLKIGYLVTFIVYSTVAIPLNLFASLQENHLLYASYVTENEASYLLSLRNSTPSYINILVIGNEIEWSPWLSQRTIINSLFGTELVYEKYAAISELNEQIQLVTTADELLRVIKEANKYNPAIIPIPDLIYYSKINQVSRWSNTEINPKIFEQMRASSCFEIKSENDFLALFKISSFCK